MKVRIGTENAQVQLISTMPGFVADTFSRYLGNKQYEMDNHLGNVLATVSDRKIPISYDTTTGTAIDHYEADVLNSQDYYPFGWEEPHRNFTTTNYRFGFNTQEKDDEIYGAGNSYTAKFWEYDPRLGRRWNLDPVIKHWEGPYTCFGDNPISFADPTGESEEQRNKAVAEAREFAKQSTGTSASYGGVTGGPGHKVDCAQMVSQCIQAGDEPNPKIQPKTLYKGEVYDSKKKQVTKGETGVMDIINQPTIKKVSINDAQVGNAITFNGEAHIGIISEVLKDDNGKLVGFEVIGSQTSTGPAVINVRIDKNGTYNTDKIGGKDVKWAGYWSPKIGEVYKWDTKPDKLNEISYIKPKSQPAFLDFVRFLKKYLNKEKVEFSSITSLLCINFQTYMHTQLGPNTAANRFKKFMQYVRRAKEQGFVSGDLSSLKRLQKYESYKVGTILSECEIATLFATPCPNLQSELVSKLQYHTTQRISDVLALTWDMLIKKEDSYVIPVLEQIKTGNKVYDIVLESELIDKFKGERKGKLFKDKYDTAIHYETLDAWTKSADIDKKVRSHAFRRSSATHLYNLGVNIVTIAKILGHVSKSGVPNPLQSMQYIGVQLDDMKPAFKLLQGVTKKEIRKVA